MRHNVVVDGVEKEMYIDDGLERRISRKILPRMKKDRDYVFVVDGKERSGKSVFAMQVAKRLDPTFNLDRVCMTADEFRTAVANAGKKQAIIYDEAYTGLSSKMSMTEINKLMVELMMEMGQKNLFIFIVLPTFFMLEKYVALFRSQGLFHVYTKKGNRGNWRFFGYRKKMWLYERGKKFMDYSDPKCTMKGKFFDFYTVNEAAYRAKKDVSLVKKDRRTRAEKWLYQRNLVIWVINKELGVKMPKVVELLQKSGIQMSHMEIYRAVTAIQTGKDDQSKAHVPFNPDAPGEDSEKFENSPEVAENS